MLGEIMNIWTIIKVGVFSGRHFSSFHVQGALTDREAMQHALNKINGDWSNHHSDYLRNCMELGNYTVTTETR
jgi:hypothetical protein